MKRSRIHTTLRTAALVLCCLSLILTGVCAAFAAVPTEVEFTVEWWDAENDTAVGYIGCTFDLYVNGECVCDDADWYQANLYSGDAYELRDLRASDDSMFVIVPDQTISGTVSYDNDTAHPLAIGPRSYSVIPVTSDFDANEDFSGDAGNYCYDVYHNGALVEQNHCGEYDYSCRYGETVEVKNIRTPGGTGTEGAVMPDSYNLSFVPDGDDYEVELTLPPLFQLDVNVVLDGSGSYMTGVEGFTFDVTVAGAYAAQGVQDYCANVPAGLTYEVKNITVPEGYYPTYTGARTGTVTGSHNEDIGLRTHEWNAAAVTQTPTTESAGYLQYTCPHCEETREFSTNLIHKEGETSVEAILYLTWRDVCCVLTNDDGALAAAPYEPGSAAQRWIFEPQENGGYRILSAADGKAVTLGGYARNGWVYRDVTLAAPDDSTEQIWFTPGDWSIAIYSAAEPYTLGLTTGEDEAHPMVCCSDNWMTWNCHEIKDIGAGFTCDLLFSDDESAVSAVGTNVEIGEFAGSPAQQWQFIRLENGAYKILNKKDGKALTAEAPEAGSNVSLAAYTGAVSQQWYALEAESGRVFLQPVSSLCVMDLTNGDTTSGTNIGLWTMHYGWQEQWNPVRYENLGESFTAWVMNAGDGRPVCCAETDDVEYNLEVHSFFDDIAVPWTFTRLADGGYTISGRDGELVWTFNTETYNVELSAATGAANQEWFVYLAWGDCYQLRPGGTNRRLDLLNGGSGGDINVQTYPRHGDVPEQWVILKTTDFPERFYAEVRPSDTNKALASDLSDLPQLAIYDGSRWQRWLFTKQTDGMYTVQNTQDGRFLWLTGNGDPVLYADGDEGEDCYGHWLISAMPAGGFTLSCARTDYYQESRFLFRNWDESVYTEFPSCSDLLWDVKVLEELTDFTLSRSSFACTGAVQRPAVTVKNAAGVVLTQDTDYTLTPAVGSKNVGTYTVKIAGKGDYIGTVSKTYKIMPAVPTGLTAAPSAANEALLSWTAAPGASSYYIYQYDAAKDSYEYIGYSTTTSYTVSGLPAWQNASFKVRGYAKVSGASYYGALTAPVSVRVLGEPAAPADVAAAATAANQITLTWTASQGATQYNIFRKAAGAASFSYLGTSYQTGYVSKNLTAGVVYAYYVTPVTKESGLTLVGANSATVSATAITTPGVPADLTAAPTAEKTLTLSWSASANATGYEVYRYNGTQNAYLPIGETQDTSFEATGLSGGTTYYFKVCAVARSGELTLKSARSAAANAKALGKPAAPTNVAVAPTAANTLTVTWTASANATQYNVFRYNGAKNAYIYVGTSYGTSYVVKNLTGGTTYYFKVAAVTKEAGLTLVSAYSAAAYAKAIAAPAAPVNAAAAPSAANEIAVTWDAVPGATQYNVYRKVGDAASFSYLTTVYTGTYTAKNCTAGTEYAFRVIPVTKESGLTLVGPAAEVSATALGTPAVPANVTAAATAENTITVTWDAVEGATQYNIYRYNGTKKTYVYIGTSYTASYDAKGLSNGTTYYFKVVSVAKTADVTLVSAKSASANAKAVGTPAVPQNVTAVSNEARQVTVSWSKVFGATQYNVYRYNSAKKAYVYVGTSYGASYIVNGLTSGTNYYFKVVAAVKANGMTFMSEKSASASARAQ